MTPAEIVAEIFGSPCNYSPIDEEMRMNCDCEHFCYSAEQSDTKCWQRYFDLKRKEGGK